MSDKAYNVEIQVMEWQPEDSRIVQEHCIEAPKDKARALALARQMCYAAELHSIVRFLYDWQERGGHGVKFATVAASENDDVTLGEMIQEAIRKADGLDQADTPCDCGSRGYLDHKPSNMSCRRAVKENLK